MGIEQLWLPILLSGLATHIYSTLAWMLLPHHKPEWNRLPVEQELLELLNRHQVPPNQYMFPFAANGNEAGTPEFKTRQACSGMLIRWATPLNMGAAIGKTLAFFMVAAACIGYLAGLAIPTPSADAAHVFRVVGTTGILTHCFAHFPHVFWFRRRIAMEVLDGIIFAMITAGIFAALWPT